MSIKVLPEEDVYVSQAELERLQYEYRQAMSFRAGPIPSFETWVKQRKSSGRDAASKPEEGK